MKLIKKNYYIAKVKIIKQQLRLYPIQFVSQVIIIIFYNLHMMK